MVSSVTLGYEQGFRHDWEAGRHTWRCTGGVKAPRAEVARVCTRQPWRLHIHCLASATDLSRGKEVALRGNPPLLASLMHRSAQPACSRGVGGSAHPNNRNHGHPQHTLAKGALPPAPRTFRTWSLSLFTPAELSTGSHRLEVESWTDINCARKRPLWPRQLGSLMPMLPRPCGHSKAANKAVCRMASRP